MIKSRLLILLGALGVALATAPVLTATSAAAQTSSRDQIRGDQTRRNQTEDLRRENRRQQAERGPSAEEILAAARQQVALTSTGCEVTNARLLGQTAEKTSIYEVACASGPGYMIESKTPPTAAECIILASSAQALRARDPAADVGSQCELPGNTDVLAAIKGYAQQAGIDCSVDQGKVLGMGENSSTVYEVGCQDAQGYWLRKTGASWAETPCIQVLAENAACEFTTTAEIAASVKTMLAGSEAASCDVTEARLMGQNANGRFYEAKCAGADGLIARLNAEKVVEQVYPCATAQRVGGGCTLTPAPAAVPESTEQ